MPNDIQNQIIELKKELDALTAEYYTNNFTGSQDFNKYSRFNTRLKVPSYASLPAVCEVGEICESGGKLRICSAANTWTIVGTQS
jgi:hypothetical protein